MNVVQEIKEYIKSKRKSLNVEVIQYSRNVTLNDTYHFLVFIGGEYKYLVTSYRKDSINRIKNEEEVLNFLNADNIPISISKSILFSFDSISIGRNCFRIQEYCDNSQYLADVKIMSEQTLEKILKLSTHWQFQLHAFLIRKKISSSLLIGELREMGNNYSNNLTVNDLLNQLIDITRLFQWDLYTCLSHGDYCYYNFIINKKDEFQVFDWEHAQKDYWQFYDLVLNHIVLWKKLFNAQKVRSVFNVICLHRISNNSEKLLFYSMEEVRKYLGMNSLQYLLLILFVYFRSSIQVGKHTVVSSEADFINVKAVMNHIYELKSDQN